MLINFTSLIKKYGKPKGIIHIGAHMIQERQEYYANGFYNTIWIEANPEIFTKIDFVNYENNNEKAFNYAICDVDDQIVDFNITNNEQSSSLFEPDKVLIYHPEVLFNKKIKVKTKRMDSLITKKNIDIAQYDFLNMDIQGSELIALKGFGNMLEKLNFIYLEVSTDYIYKDCPLIEDIDNFLKDFNFIRVETYLTNCQWGDAFYIKKN